MPPPPEPEDGAPGLELMPPEPLWPEVLIPPVPPVPEPLMPPPPPRLEEERPGFEGALPLPDDDVPPDPPVPGLLVPPPGDCD